MSDSLELVPLPSVARIDHGNGSTSIDPPLNSASSDVERLAWWAAVTTLDTGLDIKVWDGAGDARNRFAIGAAGGSVGAYDYLDAQHVLTGISFGVRAAARAAAAEAREVEGVLCEHVLTWHRVEAPDDDPGVEIPLYQHIELPAGLGELRSHAREVLPPGAVCTVHDDPEDGCLDCARAQGSNAEAPWCPHPDCHDRVHGDGTHSDEFGNPFRGAAPEVSGG